MSAVVPWNAEVADVLIAAELARIRAFYGADGGGAAPLLPILRALQDTFGFVAAEVIPLVANRLNVSKADVRGVLSFYHDFHDEPPTAHVVRLCRAEACQASGSERIAAHLAQTHGLRPGATSGAITLHNVYCLGNCALGPAALVDGELVAGLDETAADAMIARLQERS